MGELMQRSYIELDEKYRKGIALDDFKGIYSIVKARVGDNDVIYPEWAYPQRPGKREPAPVAIPVKITIGTDGKTAMETLRAIAGHLKDK